MESTENVLKDGMYHTGDYGRINNASRLVLLQRNPDIILLPTGEKISRVRTNEQIIKRMFSSSLYSIQNAAVATTTTTSTHTKLIWPAIQYYDKYIFIQSPLIKTSQ